MSFITVIDPFKKNKEKLAQVDEIITILLARFPNHQICCPSLRGRNTVYYRGQPNIHKDGINNITSIQFGLQTPEPADNRTKLFGISFKDKPKPLVIGDINIVFKEGTTEILKVTISVYGKGNKQSLLDFFRELEAGKLSNIPCLAYLQVESEEPKRLQ